MSITWEDEKEASPKPTAFGGTTLMNQAAVDAAAPVASRAPAPVTADSVVSVPYASSAPATKGSAYTSST
ncbi:MAG: hypothetical protein M3Y08_16505, partial [Fibrobacterota bacterium]|nr:hypothetical protein [Fibrobacterota bacterium]